ncbi:alpha/beta hydrolase [Leptospira perolatii]|uniref:Alpha/beta hydrolase n=2 Tax=Leptospira perolatii TaxID=2023191 RepID=A0A2M9ZL20_9LEPT|nr:alpha/beta hydrolase [Leptospira perolatii]PJZ70020.1 alpha/beta hydrolase [Leptospira perolatii]PJZ72729.1 alpha/beta hydrolase [Leptospira perolatii]
MIAYYIIGIFSLFVLGCGGLIYFNQEKLIFFPEALPADYRYSFPGNFEEIELEIPSKEKIYGIYFKSNLKKSKGVILYFHGNAGSLRTWGGISEDFVPRGWDILITDYRGYGKSKARLSEEGMYEDALLWYHYLRDKKRYSVESIVIFGRSIGTGVAVQLATKCSRSPVLLETPFTSMADLAKQFYPILPSWFLSYKFDSASKIKEISSTLHVFHGTHDEIVPFEQGKRLFEIARSAGVNAEFHPIRGGTHNDLSFFPEYQKGLESVLAKLSIHK